jgi:hypothetical protein
MMRSEKKTSPKIAKKWPSPGKTTWLGLGLILILFLTFTLASSVNQVNMKRGEYLEVEATPTPQRPTVSPGENPAGGTSPTSFNVLDILAKIIFWVLIPAVVVYYLFGSKQTWQRLVVLGLAVGGLFLFAALIQRATGGVEFDPMPVRPTLVPTPLPGKTISTPEPQMPSRSLAFLITFLISLTLLAAGYFIWKKLRPEPGDSPNLAEPVKSALEDHKAGEDIANIIIRSYYQMALALDKEKGITRKQTMTPREFTAALKNRGIPLQSIQTLTSLFEKVRYGGAKVSPQEEKEALNALQTIFAATGGRP